MSSMETLRVKAPGSSYYPSLRVMPSKRSTSKLALITPLNISISLKNRRPCLPGLLRGLRETVVVQHFREAAVKYTLPVLRNHWILENSLMFTSIHHNFLMSHHLQKGTTGQCLRIFLWMLDPSSVVKHHFVKLSKSFVPSLFT